jgi:hypothetical protein
MKTTAPQSYFSITKNFPFSMETRIFDQDCFEDTGMNLANSVAKKWTDNNHMSINQYTFICKDSAYDPIQIHAAALYLYILRTSVIKDSADGEYRGQNSSIEPCWTVTVGDQPDNYGRCRIGFNNSKLFTYAIIGGVHQNFKANLEWSHLCGNANCVRPSHIHLEDHNMNMSRIYCCGLIYNPDKDQVSIVCNHDPVCKRVRIVQTIMSAEEYLSQ